MQVLPKKKPSGRPRHARTKNELVLGFRRTVHEMIRAISGGFAREYACYGPRGDGKTWGLLGAMLAHAAEHEKQGYPLPVKWIGVTDTLTSHKLKTVRSLQDPGWAGTWKVTDGGKVATAYSNRVPVVQVDLFGIEDVGAMDRVRLETVGVWFEEPAPSALMVQSSGVDETAWSIALTSQRMPSHCYPAVMTLNYPDEDHWTWKRFQPPILSPTDMPRCGFHPDNTTRMWFQIPPGERAKAEHRQEWTTALKDRPDLLRRLIEGKPGVVLMGPQVAEGFREDQHVSRERLRPVPGEPLFVGQDFGHTPATIIGQPWRGYIRVYAALPCLRGGVRQHYEQTVLPWLASYAPWAIKGASTMLRGCYDPAGQTGEQTDIDQNPIGTIESLVGGIWHPGAIAWEARKNCLLSSLNRHVRPGELALQIDPIDGRPLVQALSGRWYYPSDRMGGVRRDLPKKPNHPWEDLGDAFIHMLEQLLIQREEPQEVRVETDFDPRTPVFV